MRLSKKSAKAGLASIWFPLSNTAWLKGTIHHISFFNMTDAPTSSSPLRQEPSLSNAERAAQELADFMTQSPGTSEAGDDFGGRDGAPSTGVEEEFPPGVLETTPPRGSDTNGTVAARRLLRQQQLTPYQRTEADQFIQVYSISPL